MTTKEKIEKRIKEINDWLLLQEGFTEGMITNVSFELSLEDNLGGDLVANHDNGKVRLDGWFADYDTDLFVDIHGTEPDWSQLRPGAKELSSARKRYQEGVMPKGYHQAINYNIVRDGKYPISDKSFFE
jgi:hypothetical protein